MMFFAQLKRHLLAPVLFAIGAGLATTGYVTGQQVRALREHGRTVDATVDRVTWKEQVSGREQAFKVDVRFVTEDRRTVQTSVIVPRADAARVGADEDGKLSVTYLPSSPTTVRLVNAPDDSTVMLGAGAALMALGLGVFVWRRRAARAAAA